MKDNKFLQEFANIRINDRYKILTTAADSLICGMTLLDIFNEIEKINDKIRPDIIRKEQLLKEYENWKRYGNKTKNK